MEDVESKELDIFLRDVGYVFKYNVDINKITVLGEGGLIQRMSLYLSSSRQDKLITGRCFEVNDKDKTFGNKLKYPIFNCYE